MKDKGNNVVIDSEDFWSLLQLAQTGIDLTKRMPHYYNPKFRANSEIIEKWFHKLKWKEVAK